VLLLAFSLLVSQFFIMVHQLTSSFSSFSAYLEFFFEFFQISVGPSNVILLATFDVHPPRNSYIFFSIVRSYK